MTLPVEHAAQTHSDISPLVIRDISARQTLFPSPTARSGKGSVETRLVNK